MLAPKVTLRTTFLFSGKDYIYIYIYKPHWAGVDPCVNLCHNTRNTGTRAETSGPTSASNHVAVSNSISLSPHCVLDLLGLAAQEFFPGLCVTACEYSGRPPNTNSHQPSLRPEQHTARYELLTRKRNMQNNTRGKGKIDLGRIIYQRGSPSRGQPRLKVDCF